jgi:hypothetical protein
MGIPAWAALLAVVVALLGALPRAGLAAPGNDAFSSATAVGTPPALLTADTSDATVESGETIFVGCALLDKTVWYTVTRPTAALVTLSTAGSSFDTAIVVHTGSSLGSLSQVACNNDFDGTPRAQVTFLASANVTYSIQVGSVSGDPGGSLMLGVTETPGPSNDPFAARVDVGALPAHLTTDTTYATVEAGEPLAQSGCPSYGKTFWYTVTRPAASQVTISTAGSGFNTVVAVYTGTSLASLTNVTCGDEFNGTPQAHVSFVAAAGTTYAILVEDSMPA